MLDEREVRLGAGQLRFTPVKSFKCVFQSQCPITETLTSDLNICTLILNAKVFFQGPNENIHSSSMMI